MIQQAEEQQQEFKRWQAQLTQQLNERIEEAIRQRQNEIEAAKESFKQEKKESERQFVNQLLQSFSQSASAPTMPEQPAPVTGEVNQSADTSESMMNLERILGEPTPVEVIGHLDLLDQFDKLATIVSQSIYNRDLGFSVALPVSDAVTLGLNPTSAALAKLIGQEGAKIVFKVGAGIDKIFRDGEQSSGGNGGQPTKDMFNN